MGMGIPTAGLTQSPQASTPPQGGKGGGRPMPPQGGKGGRPMPPQGGKGGRPMPPQGGKGGGYPQRDYGYGNQLPPQGGKGGVRGPSNVPDYMQPYVNALPPQGGGGNPMQPQVPAQGGKGNMPLPADYQSRYGNYGFDSGLQNYLDQQYVGSTRDAGVNYQYDPSTQTFTGGTMGGRYNPIPLSVMQQVAGGNRDALNPYFQSRFPQQPTTTQAPVQQPANPYTDNVAAPQLADTINSLTPKPIQPVAPRQFDPRMMRYIQMQQEQQRQQMEQQRRQQEMIMRLPPRLRQQYMQQMQQGQQPSNLGIGGLRGLLGGFR